MVCSEEGFEKYSSGNRCKNKKPLNTIRVLIYKG
jgi:hypothetical protein